MLWTMSQLKRVLMVVLSTPATAADHCGEKVGTEQGESTALESCIGGAKI